MGAVITQDNRPITFFSRKLSKMQQKNSVTELELLAIVETLKEFKGMLWGQDIKVYTDHKNLTRNSLGLTSDRVYRWRLLLEEYAPKIIYIKGIHNTVADAILQLEYDPKLNKIDEYTHAMLGAEPEELSAQQWKLPPVSFELKEGMKPYHDRPYPIPHKHKAVLMKEIKWLCNMGVLEWQPLSQQALTKFIIPKKDSTVRTVSDFRELNKRIVRKPNCIPKINTILQ